MIYKSRPQQIPNYFIISIKQRKIQLQHFCSLSCYGNSLQQYNNQIEASKMFYPNQLITNASPTVYYIQHFDRNSLTIPTFIIPTFQLYPNFQSQNYPPIIYNASPAVVAEEQPKIHPKQKGITSREHQIQCSVDFKKKSKKRQIEQSQPAPQIQSRNVLPNSINLVLSYLRRINKSGKLISKIIEKSNKPSQQYSAKKFYSYQLYLKDNIQSNINRHTLKTISTYQDPSCTIFSLEEQKFYNRVFRIAAFHFLREDCISSMISSGKTYKTRKIDHLRTYRIIRSDLQGKNRSQDESY